jgi:hypothetical protein
LKTPEIDQQLRSLVEDVTPEILCRLFPSQLRYLPFRNIHSPELEAALAVHKYAIENGGSFHVNEHFYTRFHQDFGIAKSIKTTIKNKKLQNLCNQFPALLQCVLERGPSRRGTVRATSGGLLRAALALREFSTPRQQPFDVEDFHAQHPQEFELLFRAGYREGLEVLCSKFPFLLCMKGEITLAPSFVNHVNFRFMEECKVDASDGGEIYPRVFLPTLNGRHYTPQTKTQEKFAAFGRHPYNLMFDIWDDNWANKWTQPNGQMSPQKLIPLLRWLEKQRFSKNCSMINTDKREEMQRWAVGLMNQNRVSMEKNTVEQQAKNAYRAEDGWEFGENDGWAIGKDGDESVSMEEDGGAAD